MPKKDKKSPSIIPLPEEVSMLAQSLTKMGLKRNL